MRRHAYFIFYKTKLFTDNINDQQSAKLIRYNLKAQLCIVFIQMLYMGSKQTVKRARNIVFCL